MAEEHRCQAPPEAPHLCANNCGFFGSAATLGLCSKCYRDHRLKEDQEAAAKAAVEKSLQACVPTPAAAAAAASPSSIAAVDAEESGSVTLAAPSAVAAPAPAAKPGRCGACRKKVGLTGFRCRCGDTYCGAHRYPEQHGCTFDFKAAGRGAIARANPVVKADKLDKI